MDAKETLAKLIEDAIEMVSWKLYADEQALEYCMNWTRQFQADFTARTEGRTATRETFVAELATGLRMDIEEHIPDVIRNTIYGWLLGLILPFVDWPHLAEQLLRLVSHCGTAHASNGGRNHR